MDYLYTSPDGNGDFELIESIPAAWPEADAYAVGRAFIHAISNGVKEVHVFHMDESRWFAHIELP